MLLHRVTSFRLGHRVLARPSFIWVATTRPRQLLTDPRNGILAEAEMRCHDMDMGRLLVVVLVESRP